MHGNVWEWCRASMQIIGDDSDLGEQASSEIYAEGWYVGAPNADPPIVLPSPRLKEICSDSELSDP